MSEPIIVSSQRYSWLRERGYIDEYGQFTDKFEGDFHEQFKQMIDKVRNSKENAEESRDA